MNEQSLKVYDPEVLTKHLINELIDKGVRFDIIPGLEPEEYDDPMEEVKGDKEDGSKSIIGSIF